MASETKSQGKDSFFAHIAGSKFVQRTQPFQTFLRKFNNDWSTTFAGALAYSLLTAMLPIAIALVAILGFILGTILKNPVTAQTWVDQLGQVYKLSEETKKDLTGNVSRQLSQSAGYLAIISVSLAVFGGSRLFVAIENAMSIVYRVRPRAPLPQNLVAIGMTLIFILLIPIMIFSITLPTLILNILGSNPALTRIPFFSAIASNSVTLSIAAYVGGFIAGFLLFFAIYTIVPNQRIRLQNSWRGAVVSALLLSLFISLFPIYTSRFLGNYTGQIGFAVILLVFFYYFAVILILGAEVNAFFFEKVQPLPNDVATFISTIAGNINKDRPESESPNHVDSKPTEHASEAYIAEIRAEEQAIQARNQEKQHSLAARQRAKEQPTDKATKKKLQPTLFEVGLGAVVAVVVALFQWRQHK